MKKLFKTQMKFLGIAITSVALGVCINNTKQNTYNAKAATTVTTVTSLADVDSFVMEKGASVRVASTSADAGLSFSATLDNAQYDELSKLGTVKVGFALAPKNYADIYALTEEYLFGSGAKYYFEDNKIEVDEGLNEKGQVEIFNIDTPRIKVEGSTRTYIGSIVNFGSLTADLMREYVCAGYIEFTPNGTTTPQYLMAKHFENDVKNSTRSMVYVAQRALEADTEIVTDKEAFKNAYLTADVLSKDVTYTTNVYVNDMLIESKTDNVAKINDTVSYENTAYENFAGYADSKALVYTGGRTVLDVRLTAQASEVYEYLATWTAYDFSKPFQLIPITEGAETILDADNNNLSIKKLGAGGFGQTSDTTLTGNRQYLIKDYGLMGKEVEYLALYSNGTVTKYTIVPVTKKIANRNDLETIFTANESGLKAGVYVLTADIDMSDKTWDNNIKRYLAGSQDLSTYTYNINGFQGIFDGAGHTISNLTTEMTFFGSVHPGSIIRNIAFTNVKETSVKGFLSGVCAAELNNVYVSYAEDQAKELALTEDYKNGLVLNNVVIDYTNHVNTVGSGAGLSYRGVLNGFGGNATTLSKNNNFFVISDMPMIVETDASSVYKRIVDAFNVKLNATDYMDNLEQYGFLGTLTDSKIGHATNKSVLRFDKADDMKEYLKADQAEGGAKTLDLSGFNLKYWTFNAETGALTWGVANN